MKKLILSISILVLTFLWICQTASPFSYQNLKNAKSETNTLIDSAAIVLK